MEEELIILLLQESFIREKGWNGRNRLQIIAELAFKQPLIYYYVIKPPDSYFKQYCYPLD